MFLYVIIYFWMEGNVMYFFFEQIIHKNVTKCKISEKKQQHIKLNPKTISTGLQGLQK